jgi:hypothetical protein
MHLFLIRRRRGKVKREWGFFGLRKLNSGVKGNHRKIHGGDNGAEEDPWGKALTEAQRGNVKD